jgi:hypothetical protein
MNLSTSNFRSEVKVLAVVLLILAGIEITLRVFESRLSLDIVHINQLPSVAQKLALGEGKKILFLGNSRTRLGVDTNVIQTAFGEANLPVTLARAYPDDTEIVDWYYIFKHFFVDAKTLPDVLVVGFGGRNLADTPIRLEQPRRIGRHFSSLSDSPNLFRYDLTTVGQRSEYLLSHALVSFANRERVRKRLLTLIIPGYQTLATTLNAPLLRPNTTDLATTKQSKVSYERLQRFIELAQSYNTQLLFVAMPEQTLYPLDTDLIDLLANQGVQFLDARRLQGLDETDFMDDIHVNSEGAKKYSAYLVPYLTKMAED